MKPGTFCCKFPFKSPGEELICYFIKGGRGRAWREVIGGRLAFFFCKTVTSRTAQLAAMHFCHPNKHEKMHVCSTDRAAGLIHFKSNIIFFGQEK